MGTGITTARVGERGRVCINKPVREQLDIKPGDLVRIQVEAIGGPDE